MTTRLPQLGINVRLPVILQIEASECGLACLAMVANYHGHRTDLETLRRRFSISRKGVTLDSLIRIADALRLECRPLRLEMEHLSELQLPCVLHWDMNHFVVLKSVSQRRIVIHDPAIGERSFSFDAFAEHFTGIALELNPGGDFATQSQPPRLGLRRMLGNVVGLKRGIVQILLLATAMEIIAVMMPFLLQWVVDHALVGADRNLLAVLGIGFILLVIIQAAMNAVRSWFVVALSTHLNFQWLGNVFSHLVKLPLDFFEKRHVGHIMSCFGSISTIQHTLTSGFVQALVDGLLVAGTLAMMLLYSAHLTLVTVIAIAFYVVLRWVVFRSLRSATAEKIIHEAKQQTHFLETASGAQCVRLFDRGETRRIGWMNMLADQFNAELRIERIHISYDTANKLIFGIERVLVIWLAARMVLDNSFTTGMLLAFIAYKDQLSTRITALIDRLFDLTMLKLHVERVADILGTPPEINALDDEIDTDDLTAAIELRNVSFRYAPTEDNVIDAVDLKIGSGECVAITGASGCGKTTLAKLMLGLLAPSDGEIRVGGVPIQRIGLNNYRRMIGTVMQEDRLFTGSIADNICFFDSTHDDNFIEQCARMAAVHDDILAMPMGYNTLVSDVGIGLSGGQKQRILLARALYRKPRILVLDEATSHLDIDNERLVNDTVKTLNLTRIIIAHRPETIAMANRVISLDRGSVQRDFHVPSATHGEMS